jgi:glycolate oxidase
MFSTPADGNLHPLILYDNRVEVAWAEVEELGGEILKLLCAGWGQFIGRTWHRHR